MKLMGGNVVGEWCVVCVIVGVGDVVGKLDDVMFG